MMHHFEDEIRARYEHEPEFLQAHEEIAESLQALFDEEPRYLDLFKYLSEPDRIVSFRVAWRDDQGALQINRGYRVQFSNALGPYKGGLRFHPTVNVSLLKFLGLEQTLKNALTGLCLGGGKGGSDFDPKGKSDNEVRAFCYAFMTELRRHIGPNTDVPAGDIGVGSREIGYLFGCYKRLQNVQCGVITGKGPDWGGSYLRPEATGYGAVYFAEAAAKHFDLGPLRGKSCVVSGAGNAAQYTCEKLIELGAKVISVSDSKGTLLYKDGMTQEDLAEVMHHKNTIRAPLGELDTSNTYVAGQQPWDCVDTVDFAFPCACQNEISGAQAKRMVSNGVRLMVEVANMPLTADAHACLKEGGVLICPSKAANSGGVAVSGLEMAQNGCWTQWEKSKVDDMLKDIMASVFDKCLDAARRYSEERDLDTGANVAGFLRVAKAMTDQGFFLEMTTQWVIDEVKVEERWRSRKVAGKYQNFVPPPQAGFGMVLQRFGKWMCAPNRDPQKPLPIEPLTRELLLGADSLSLWKIGHSTVLFKVADKFYITDPVFSERASPFTWLGPKRFTPPAIALTELPPLEGIILSHDHYDHLDVPSLKVLAPTTKYFVCPLGQEEVLTTQVGVEASRIVSLDWWQRATFDRTVSFTCVPGQHFTARTLSDRFDRLWCSWAIEFKEPAFKLFFMGDSGFNEEMHRAIGEVCGPFDVCLMENGQYSDAWCFAHSHPEETVREFELLRGRWLIPIHNCTFTLAFHAWHEPLERVYHLCAERNLNLCTPKFGERVDLKNVQPLARWWRPIMATERGEENIKLPTNEDPIRPANELKQ